MNFEVVFKLLLENFEKEKVHFALIGGFALHVAGYPRATNDIDFLVAKEDMSKVRNIMLVHGYKPHHESEDVSNFSSELTPLGQVDFLHAHRKYSRAMLERANKQDIFEGKIKVRVIIPEDLIGLKVQSSSNDRNRYTQDMLDIEHVMKANKGRLDIPLIRDYFDLFGRKDEFEKILEKLNET